MYISIFYNLQACLLANKYITLKRSTFYRIFCRTFNGLGSLISKSHPHECDEEPEVSAKDNYLMAVEEPQDVIEDFYNSYTKFLDELCDSPDVSLTNGLKENDGEIYQKQFPVSDDNNESCKKCFDTIHSDETKMIWSRPAENIGSNPSQPPNNASRSLVSARFSQDESENSGSTGFQNKAGSIEQITGNRYGNSTVGNVKNRWEQQVQKQIDLMNKHQTPTHWSDLRVQNAAPRSFQAENNKKRTMRFEDGSMPINAEESVRKTGEDFPQYSLFDKGGLKPIFGQVSQAKESKDEYIPPHLCHSLLANSDKEQIQLSMSSKHGPDVEPISSAWQTHGRGPQTAYTQTQVPPKDAVSKRLYPQLENIDLSEQDMDQSQVGILRCVSSLEGEHYHETPTPWI